MSPARRAPVPVVLLVLVVLLLLAAGVVAMRRGVPLHELHAPTDLKALLAPVLDSPWLWAWDLLAFVVASAFFVSVWLVIFQTSLLFGALPAFGLSLAGALLASTTFYALGRLLGAQLVQRYAGERVRMLIGDARLEGIIAIRVLPVLPFTVVNVAAGAFAVPWRRFVLGTAIGMTPGILAMTFLGARVLEAVQHPTWQSVGALVIVVIVLVGIASALRVRMNARARSGP